MIIREARQLPKH